MSSKYIYKKNDLIAFRIFFFFFLFHFGNLERNNRLQSTQQTVYVGHICPFMYHFVSIVRTAVYTILYIAEIGRQRPSSKKFITVTSREHGAKSKRFFWLLSYYHHLCHYRRLDFRFKSTNLMDRRSYQDITRGYNAYTHTTNIYVISRAYCPVPTYYNIYVFL